MINWVC